MSFGDRRPCASDRVNAGVSLDVKCAIDLNHRLSPLCLCSPNAPVSGINSRAILFNPAPPLFTYTEIDRHTHLLTLSPRSKHTHTHTHSLQ